MTTLEPGECRQEAIRRVTLSDKLFNEYKTEEGERAESGLRYSEISHLRQTAVVYAILATESGPS